MNEELKKLVKTHFNLVDAPAVVEETMAEAAVETTNEAFGEILTADGELTLTYEGEELVVGLPIFVKTEDGNIPAPDGKHELEGGIYIETEGGVTTEVSTVDAVEEEITEEITEEEMSDEETLSNDFKELLKMLSGEFKKELKAIREEFQSKLNVVDGKVENFSSAPATEKTNTNTKQTYGKQSSVDVSYNPSDASKKAQFERLLKARKN